MQLFDENLIIIKKAINIFCLPIGGILDNTSLLTAQSPAALAEEYIVKSIWNNHFAAGSDLPAERELAEHIGVTRTTLREVLQRLARDGWLQIQHGKPTRVNNIWETGGPNIIKTIIKLDRSYLPVIISNVVSLRTRMVEYYVREAVKINAKASADLFHALNELENTALAYATFDYNLFRQFTFIANKPVYGLILNSFKEMYIQVASLFFRDEIARQGTFHFYETLKSLCEQGDDEGVQQCIAKNRQQSGVYWAKILQHLPEDFGK